MTKPLSRILVIEDEPLVLREIVKGLNAAARSQTRTELHGIVHEGYQPCVRVLKPPEERGLRRIG